MISLRTFRLLTPLAIFLALLSPQAGLAAPDPGLFAGRGLAARPVAAGITIATSQALFADMIANVVGDRAEIYTVVPASADPHDYDPTPADAVAVSQAAVYFANGLNQELFLRRLVQNANPGLRVVTMSDGLKIVGKGGINSEFQEAGNPHMWLNVRNGMAYVEVIRDTMVEIDPANADYYIANAAAYLAQLDALDQETLESISVIPVQNRKIVTFHDAFPYYADRYGMEDFAVVSLDPQSEPSAYEYAALVDKLKSAGIKAIFGEVGFSSKVVQQLASDVGAKFVPNLYSDAMGLTSDTNSYIKIVRWDTRLFVENLR